MMQFKFNFNKFTFYGVSATAWQRASGMRRRGWRLWLAVATSSRLSNNDVIALRPLRQFRYVPYVACIALDGNPALDWCGVAMWAKLAKNNCLHLFLCFGFNWFYAKQRYYISVHSYFSFFSVILLTLFTKEIIYLTYIYFLVWFQMQEGCRSRQLEHKAGEWTKSRCSAAEENQRIAGNNKF